MKEYYFVEKSPTKDMYVIHLNFELFGDKLQTTQGSYGILAARLLGLDYPSYVRLAASNYGATVVGKNSLYPTFYYSNLAKAKSLAAELNKRVDKLLSANK